MHLPRNTTSRHVTATPSWVLVLVRDPMARARLTDALRGRATLRPVATVAAAHALLRQAPTFPLAAILEASDVDGQSVSVLCRHLIERQPAVAVIGYCVPGERQGREILEFARAGVHELLFHGIDDGAFAVERLVAGAVHLCAADEVAAQVAPLLPPRTHAFMLFCLRHPEITTVTAVAAALAVHRKTLFIRCTHAHLPPPGILLGWARLLLAAHMLGGSYRTIEAVAMELEFASVNALRNMLMRYTGLRPREVRAGGGLAMVLPHFHRALEAGGTPLPTSASPTRVA